MTRRTDESQVRIPGAAIRLDASAGGLAQWQKRGRSLLAAWVLNPRVGGRAGPQRLRLGAGVPSQEWRMWVASSTPSAVLGLFLSAGALGESSGIDPFARRFLSIYCVPGRA